MLYVVELTYPGEHLDYPDDQWTEARERQLGGFESPLAEAALALTWFEQSAPARRAAPSTEDRKAELQRWRDLEKKIAAELGVNARYDQILLRVEIERKHERWQRGVLPKAYEFQVPFMHAKTFLYALDRIDKLLDVLASTPQVPAAVATAWKRFRDSVPDLQGVRNSVAHYEDRSRGLDRKGKPLDLKPTSLPFAPGFLGTCLAIEILHGNRLGWTMAEGHGGWFEVSRTTLEAAGTVIQAAINAFRWKGSPRHWPG